MDALPLMVQAAAAFRTRLGAEPGCIVLPLPPVVPHDPPPSAAALLWDNLLLRSDTFRRAHVETLDVAERVSVLHVCVFPHLDDPTPIFGFDMIAGPSKVTGIFLDLSPVTNRRPEPRLRDLVGPSALASFAKRRTLPDWGSIFSDDILAVRPIDIEEVSRAILMAEKAVDGMLKSRHVPAEAAPADIAVGQASYVAAQRRNEHTLRMLAGFIGLEPARRFVEEVLFPLEQG